MSKLKRKILYISGTRADYGLTREVLFAIKKHPKLDIEIVVTGMHLMLEFGNTVKEIEKDGFKVHKVKAVYEKDKPESMVKFIGDFVLELLKEVKKIKPDMIFVQGDRVEMLGGAIIGAYLGLPVIHSHGGDVSSTVDEITRHSITKLSHIHFSATKKSAERILKMGENKKMVYFVGAPGIEAILKGKLISKKEISKKYNLDSQKPILLAVQHPVTSEIKDASKQIKATMEAIGELKYQTVVVYPNADPGGREMIKVIKKYRKYPLIKIYKSISHKDYLSLMKIADVLMGNSSSGIIEAPSFKLPVVNIGTRQENRERAGNTIDVDYSKNQIKKAVKKALFDKRFKDKVRKIKSPYRRGNTSRKVVDILSKIEISEKLLNKKIAY